MEVIKQLAILTPLTSSKNEFVTNQKHLDAFNYIKELLTKEPLFGNLIDERQKNTCFVMLPHLVVFWVRYYCRNKGK